MTTAAPSGVVTFLFTDMEGSTRRWEADADGMRRAIVAHDKVLRTAIEAHDGFLFSHTGGRWVFGGIQGDHVGVAFRRWG
jgi:class 3 adenylate cyclase